jgi:hypothetical protein
MGKVAVEHVDAGRRPSPPRFRHPAWTAAAVAIEHIVRRRLPRSRSRHGREESWTLIRDNEAASGGSGRELLVTRNQA